MDAPRIANVKPAWPEAVVYPKKGGAEPKRPRKPGDKPAAPRADAPAPEPPPCVARGLPVGKTIRFDPEREEWRVATAGNRKSLI